MPCGASTMQNPVSSSSCPHTFADRHIHGIAGVDFATSNTKNIRAALALLATRRTTRVTASIPTIELSRLTEVLNRLRPLQRAELLDGVHLEGPFIAEQYAGAHPRAAILSPSDPNGIAYLKTVVERQSVGPLVTMMTLAPEITGFTDTAEQLVCHGITPALGHTAANYQQMLHGIDTVHRLTGQPVVITHLYNAMRGFHHRDPGPLLAIIEAAASGKVIVELIGDGCHVDLSLIWWWLERHPGAVRLVSDASAATIPAGSQPVSPTPPRLGQLALQYPSSGGPKIFGTETLASGGKDLLAIHDDLVTAGFDHERVCTAMRSL